MLYLDTSLIVAAFANEEATGQVHSWLMTQNLAELSISDWTITETSSAFAFKLRTGQITTDERAAALAMLNRLTSQSFTVLPVAAAHFRAAARYADQHTLGLGSGDALHLAIAAGHGATLHTLDHRLAKVGPTFGVPTRLLA